MKSVHLLYLVLTLLICACGSGGNEPIDEGVITYAIDYPDSKDNFFLYHVLPKELKASFKDSKMELKINKAGMENTIIIDGKNKDICAYYNYGEIFSTNLNNSDIISLLNKHPDYKITFTKEKDTLAGFNVQKAIAVDPTKPSEKIEIWYTNDIAFKNPNWFNGFEKIPGVMLKYSIVQYGIKMDFIATKFEDVTISDSVVSLSRAGKKIAHTDYDKKITDLFDSFK